MKNYAHIQTFGCSANQNNTEIMSGLLTQSGHTLTNNHEIADVIILNTCVVKQKTESKIKRQIQDLYKQYPDKTLVVTGCMPQTDAGHIKKLHPHVVLLGTNQYKQIVNLLRDVRENKLTLEKQQKYLLNTREEKIVLPKISEKKLIAITQISEGCLYNCGFCKTKLAKGNAYSYSQEKILTSIKNDLKNGAKEVWITSQDCSVYGMDKGYKISQLPNLLRKIIALPYSFKIRLGMMNPSFTHPIIDELIEVYHSSKMYKFLHIPIQTASDKLLKEMQRPGSIKQTEEIIQKFKKVFPEMTIATDIIVGYPSETEIDHQKNIEFIEIYKPDVLNLSKFSLHKNTPVHKKLQQNKLQVLENSFSQIPIEIMNKRTTEIMRIHKKTAAENKQKYLHKEIKVFVDTELSHEIYESRDENYTIILVPTKERNIFGKSVLVIIKEIGVHHMLGELI